MNRLTETEKAIEKCQKCGAFVFNSQPLPEPYKEELN